MEALGGYEQAVGELGVAVGQCKAKERSCSHPWKLQLQNAWEVARAQQKTATPHIQMAECTVVSTRPVQYL